MKIDLTSLTHNLNYFKSLLQPATKIMAMVKAFSYGLGTYEIAKLMEDSEVSYLGVANIFEGIELRNAGITLPIMVMKPEVESFDLVIKYDLSPTIFSIKSLKLLIVALKKNAMDVSSSFSINLKIETGMNRIGFAKEDIDNLLVLLKEHPFLKIATVFSHLAAAEEPTHDAFTINQIDQFKKIADRISNTLGYPIDKHILNSSGIVRFNAYQMDMVRLGIGLYGISSELSSQQKLKPVSTLQSKIAQIKTVTKGQTVGYNRKGIAKKDLVIATVPVGYADGLSRKLGNGKWDMIVNGKKTPIIGNVCMDMVMINVTDIECEEGDIAIIFGEKNPITAMAKCIGTIPYEILTSYSPRVKRVFI